MPVVLPPSSTCSASHTHLLSHYYGINGDSPIEQDSPTTILPCQFDGTQSLFEVATRLVNGKDLSNDALATITGKSATNKMTNNAIKVIEKSVLPLMNIALTMPWRSTNLVGPLDGGKYAHRREEFNKKKKIKSSKIIENTGLVMVKEFVNGHSPPYKWVQLKRTVTSLDDPLPLPVLPANGVEYKVGEFVDIIQA